MNFHSPKCFDVSLTQENLHTKTINWKVPSFAIQVSLPLTLTQKTEVKHLNNTQEQTESRHARKESRRDSNVLPKTQQPYPEIASRQSRIASRFCFRRQPLFCQENRGTPLKIAPRFWRFTESQFWVKFQQKSKLILSQTVTLLVIQSWSFCEWLFRIYIISYNLFASHIFPSLKIIMFTIRPNSGGVRVIIKSGQKKKIATHIYRGLHKKLQANNQKSKEIVQIIGVYIRKVRGIYIRNCKKFRPELGQVSRLAGP